LIRSEFESYLTECKESISLIIANISKSSSISNNFKTIASDRTNEKTKQFNLKHYLEEIILSLKPQIRKTKHIIQINVPEHIEISTYPGVLSQVISNLVINSLIHGFDGIEEGVISIDAGIDNDSIIMVYSDNGNGISEENLSRIFTPFFTTKKDRGGTGIGLSIVRNLIEGTLKGKISCESAQGKGTMFKISFSAKL
jgi:signal transduction histidine kinase